MRSKALLTVVAITTVAGIAFADAPARAGGDPKPDLKVSKKQSGPYVGENQFAPAPQTIVRRAKIGIKKNVYVEIENDGNGGAVVVTGSTGHDELKLKYFLGKNNVSADVKGTGLVRFLSPGQTKTIRVLLRAFPGETDEQFSVNATDTGTHLFDDAVGIFVNVPPFD